MILPKVCQGGQATQHGFAYIAIFTQRVQNSDGVGGETTNIKERNNFIHHDSMWKSIICGITFLIVV